MPSLGFPRIANYNYDSAAPEPQLTKKTKKLKTQKMKNNKLEQISIMLLFSLS